MNNQITLNGGPQINYIKFLKFIPITIIIASIIIIFFTINSPSENGVISLISGYSGLLAGIIFFLILSFVSLGNITIGYIIDIFPFILLLIVVIVSLVFTSKYASNLAQGHVATEYYMYSYLSLFFIIVQIWFLLKGNLGQPNYSLLCLLWTLNIIVVIIISILLQFYGTNG